MRRGVSRPGAEGKPGYAIPRRLLRLPQPPCDLKLKRLTESQASALADTPDENGARRSYLLMELARNRNDLDEQTRIVTRMETDFPQSQWLAEALFSSGNMYLLRKDYPRAAEYYSYLAAHFPSTRMRPRRTGGQVG